MKTQVVTAQNSITFEKNITFPVGDGKGNAVYDIISANGKIFAYAATGILIYDQSGNYINQISFTNGSSGKYGKFQPQYYDKRLWTDAVKLMTVKNDGNNIKIYAVTPLLNIIRISTTEPYLIEYTYNRPDSINSFKPMHRPNIIKYDNVHHRLYWMIKGRNPATNCNGQFHYMERYLAIFDEDTDGNLSLYYHEQKIGTEDYINNNISDVVFNLNNNSNNDYFYLSKLDKIEVWEFVSDTSKIQLIKTINVDSNFYDNYYKFGRMLYVKNNSIGIHKIIAVPYSYPSAAITPKIYVIDGNHTSDPNSVMVQILNAPSKKILDATFSTGDTDLIVSYAPDTGELMQSNISDIAVYHYNSQSNNFSNTPILINTNNSETISYDDINSSFKLLNVDQNNILISKKDEIVNLKWNQSEGTYSHNVILSGDENNFFMASAKGSTNSFVINEAKNGIEVFSNSNFSHLSTIPVSFSAYRIATNPEGNKQYYFNNLETYNTGIYVYDKSDHSVININNDQYNDNNIEKAVGDCIYNAFTGNFLISENAAFGNSPAIVKVINATDNSLVSDIQLVDENGNNAQYAKEMFISPAGKLYIAANMKFSQNTKPKIFVFDAKNYNLIKTISINVPTPTNYTPVFYTANFCYNKANDSVYATVLAQEKTFSPYNTMYNTIFNFTNSNRFYDNNGVLCNLDADPFYSINMKFPGKIICPSSETETGTSQFDGKIFIISTTLKIFDYYKSTFDITTQKLNDIVYNPQKDELYGFEDSSNSCNTDRKAIIYKIEYDNNGQLTFTKMGEYLGQISSIFFNQYNGMLYVHTKFDRYKLGATPALLLEFDPSASNGNYLQESIALNNYTYPQNRSFYPELDNNPNDYHYHNYNLTTPYIDPYTNKIYLPNGGHSDVSVVDFVPDEALTLKPYDGDKQGSFTWLSFPRLQNSSPTVQNVLGGDNIVPNNKPYVYYKQGSQLENLPLGHDNSVFNTYNGTSWDNSGYLTNINSTLGYKLTLDYNTNPNQDINLYLHGNVIAPATTIAQLYAGKENWIGYWLYREQDIFDALGSTADHIISIKHQNWTCIYTQDIFAPGGDPVVIGPKWVCDSKNTNIKYGDMVILKGNEDIYNFNWNINGNPPAMLQESSPQYFSYEEQADYTPVVVLLDSADQPLEIGVFENDSCIGANTVNNGDSTVVIRSYIYGDSTDSLTFQKYYGTKSTQQSKITDYYARNNRQHHFEKRTIKVGEKADFFVVSFRKPKNINNQNEMISFTVWPNPVSKNLLMEYTIADNNRVTVEVFNTEGKRVAMPVNSYKNKGIYRTTWNLTGFSGKKLKNGLYLLKLTSGNKMTVKKVLIQ